MGGSCADADAPHLAGDVRFHRPRLPDRAGKSALIGDPSQMPVDLAAVQADDALLDRIAAGKRTGDDVEDLALVLARWRSEVHTDSVQELVSTDTALAAVHWGRADARRRRPRGLGWLRLAAVVFALAVIVFCALGLAAQGAQPGDRLCELARVLYGDPTSC